MPCSLWGNPGNITLLTSWDMDQKYKLVEKLFLSLLFPDHLSPYVEYTMDDNYIIPTVSVFCCRKYYTWPSGSHAYWQLSAWHPGCPCIGRQWPTCFYLVETLTQNSTISPPNSLVFHWQVVTTSTLCFKSPMAFVVHISQTQTLLPYLSLLNPDKLPCEGRHATNLVTKQQ